MSEQLTKKKAGALGAALNGVQKEGESVITKLMGASPDSIPGQPEASATEEGKASGLSKDAVGEQERKETPVKELEAEQDLYTSIRQQRNRWPLLPDPKVTLDKLPQGVKDMPVPVSFKMSMSLETTLDLHLGLIGINKSEWLRRAVETLLSLEQEYLGSGGN